MSINDKNRLLFQPCQLNRSLKKREHKLGRPRERRYQLTAARRNDAIIKHDHNLEIARYFERECNIARKFDAWSTAQVVSASDKHLAISRRGESLASRRIKLKDLLEKEEKSYAHEARQRARPTKASRLPNSDLLSDKRAEDQLYRPLNCRRIQSYFCGAFGTCQDYARPVLKEFNERNTRRAPSRLSMERTNLRQEVDASNERTERNKDASTVLAENNEKEQKNYNERMDEYKENWRSARSSNLYGDDNSTVEVKRTTHTANYQTSNVIDTQEHRPRSRKLHDSHFSLGNGDADQHFLQHADANDVAYSGKFRDRYANKSLEGANVGGATEQTHENAQRSSDGAAEPDEEKGLDEQNQTDEQDQTDHAYEKEHEDIEAQENDDKEEQDSSSIRVKSPVDSQRNEEDHQRQQQLETDQANEQHDIDREVNAKASAGRSDHRHFETEKSLPWMRMIPGDKNLSEQMFLYLTHNELKERIQNLEKRENQACSKHQWDEALRLRDMRNRLDVAREKNLYRRDDLQLDPEVKRLGMASIEARQKLLKGREEVCTNSSMYSEEAKAMWDQWVREDRQSVLEDARLQREVLMEQLEENWRSLAVDDKQRISDSFKDKRMADIEIRNDDDNLSIYVPATQ